MEARSTLREATVSRTFVAAILVLVAMGLGAMGGYAVKGLSTNGNTSAAAVQQVHPAAGTVLRQDSPAQVQVHPAAGTILRQDNPAQNGAGDTSSIRAISGGTRGDHGQLP